MRPPTGGAPITDECVAVSTTSDATGTYNRYGFHLGSNFFDYPHLGVWPDAYYMSMNVFNSSARPTSARSLLPSIARRCWRARPATFISPVGPLGGSVPPFLPADLDGSTLPPAGAPNTFVGFPSGNQYTAYHFHVDFATPGNSTFTTFATPPAAGFTALCPTTRSCVPELGVTSANKLDGIGDRLMFRLAYRNFGDHEALVGNFTVSSGGVAGIRWFELRGVTAGPVTVFQESTYQPDTTWRWMGSTAMDRQGNLAIGFSASSSTINPQIRYAGRLATDPLNTLAQGEAHLFDGTGSQTGTSNRWGDYSALTIDPVDDATFWYTNEYYSCTTTFNWRTRIGIVRVELRVAGPLFANPWPRISGLERTPATGFNAVSVSQISTHLKERATKGSAAIQKKIALTTNAGSTSAIFSSKKPRDWSVSAESEKGFLMTAYLVICRVQFYFHGDYYDQISSPPATAATWSASTMSQAKSIGVPRNARPIRLRMPRVPCSASADRPQSSGPSRPLSAFLLPFLPSPCGMRKTAFLGFFIGIALGCLFGAVMAVLPEGDSSKEQPAALSVNERTGKPQLHIKGKPEIK